MDPKHVQMGVGIGACATAGLAALFLGLGFGNVYQQVKSHDNPHPQKPNGVNPSPWTISEADVRGTLQNPLQYLRAHRMTGLLTALPGNPNIALTLIPTYLVPKVDLFSGLADVYDNSLAALYATALGDGVIASGIMNSLLALMVQEGYWPKGASLEDRIANYHGLYARYDGTTGLHSSGAGNKLYREMAVDVGNNAYLGIALCKFARKLPSTFPGKSIYERAAYDQFMFIYRNFRCSESPYGGFFGRVEQHWVSTEHNSDMFSLASNIQKLASDPNTMLRPEASVLPAARDGAEVARNFVHAMFYEGPGNGYYLTGTGICSPTTKRAEPDIVPSDCQSWNYLSGVDPVPDRKVTSMAFLVTENQTVDANILPNGCGMFSSVPCTPSHVPSAKMFTGFKFSNLGDGIQWENTGAGLMALAMYTLGTDGLSESRPSYDLLQGVIKNSVLKILQITGSGGVPAAFRSEPPEQTGPSAAQAAQTINRHAMGMLSMGAMPTGAVLAAETPTHPAAAAAFNTGLSWSYFNHPHTASTMYCGFSMWFVLTKGDQEFNPYGTKVDLAARPFNYGDLVDPSTWVNALPHGVFCPYEHANWPKGEHCGIGDDSDAGYGAVIDQYCGYFRTHATDWMDNPQAGSIAKDVLGVNKNYQFVDACDSPYLRVCKPRAMAIGVQTMFKQNKKCSGGSGNCGC